LSHQFLQDSLGDDIVDLVLGVSKLYLAWKELIPPLQSGNIGIGTFYAFQKWWIYQKKLPSLMFFHKFVNKSFWWLWFHLQLSQPACCHSWANVMCIRLPWMRLVTMSSSSTLQPSQEGYCNKKDYHMNHIKKTVCQWCLGTFCVRMWGTIFTPLCWHKIVQSVSQSERWKSDCQPVFPRTYKPN
jgi:hypothetical protein